MDTTITGFHQDEAGDWVAELACDHSQHMRHRPPWTVRPWVTTAQGRQAKLGASIACPLCARIAMPPNAREYKRTQTFSELTLPTALRAAHRTKAGTWARIVVEAGELEYHTRARVQRLRPSVVGLVEPERPHHVTPLGPVLVHVEFWREPER